MEKVRITKSNCTFVRVGDITEITTVNGRKRMWSKHFKTYEWLTWVVNAWGVQYEALGDK